jgi:hypothetical protein
MKFKLITIISVYFFMLSCSNNESACSYEANSPIISVEGPTATTVNQPIEIALVYQVSSDCGNFSRYLEENNMNTTQILMRAQYEGCECEEEATLKNTSYTFSRSQVGTYTLRFRTVNGAIVHIVEVTN